MNENHFLDVNCEKCGNKNTEGHLCHFETPDTIEEIVDNPIYASKWLRDTYGLSDGENLKDFEVEEMLQVFIDTVMKQTLKQHEARVREGLFTKEEVLEIIGENMKPTGTIVIDGVEVEAKLHSNMEVGYNTAKAEARERLQALSQEDKK